MKIENIILLTDFGSNHYVGQMKLMFHSAIPKINIIDLSHRVEPQNIKEASFILENSVGLIPNNSIVQIIVDPKVGSDREIVLVEIENNVFIICTNNGILTPLWDIIKNVWILDRNKLELGSTSSKTKYDLSPMTIQVIRNNRDAYFNKSKKNELYTVNIEADYANDFITGEILFHDSFGNAITNIELKEKDLAVVNYRDINIPIAESYSDVLDEGVLAYIGNMGTIELAVRNSNFQKKFKSTSGEIIKLNFLNI